MRFAFALMRPRTSLEAGRLRVLLRPANDNMEDDPPPALATRAVRPPWRVRGRRYPIVYCLLAS